KAVSENGSIRSFPRRAAAKADTHRRIVRSALALFQRHGYEETRVEDIAALAGVTKRTVFLHFPTKADLLFDVAAEELHRLDAPILAQPPRDNDVQTLEHALLELCRGMDRKVRHKQLKLLLRAAATSAELRGRQLDYNQMMVNSAAEALAHRHGAQTASLSSL